MNRLIKIWIAAAVISTVVFYGIPEYTPFKRGQYVEQWGIIGKSGTVVSCSDHRTCLVKTRGRFCEDYQSRDDCSSHDAIYERPFKISDRDAIFKIKTSDESYEVKNTKIANIKHRAQKKLLNRIKKAKYIDIIQQWSTTDIRTEPKYRWFFQ